MVEEIGLNALLEYDDSEILKVDFSMYEVQFWDKTCICNWGKQGIIDALVISTFDKQICYQIRPGMNKPTLKSLCHWPNAKFEYIAN